MYVVRRMTTQSKSASRVTLAIRMDDRTPIHGEPTFNVFRLSPPDAARGRRRSDWKTPFRSSVGTTTRASFGASWPMRGHDGRCNSDSGAVRSSRDARVIACLGAWGRKEHGTSRIRHRRRPNGVSHRRRSPSTGRASVNRSQRLTSARAPLIRPAKSLHHRKQCEASRHDLQD